MFLANKVHKKAFQHKQTPLNFSVLKGFDIADVDRTNKTNNDSLSIIRSIKYFIEVLASV
jgi:hypothetical protein